jgi:hypothetical protein
VQRTLGSLRLRVLAGMDVRVLFAVRQGALHLHVVRREQASA